MSRRPGTLALGPDLSLEIMFSMVLGITLRSFLLSELKVFRFLTFESLSFD